MRNRTTTARYIWTGNNRAPAGSVLLLLPIAGLMLSHGWMPNVTPRTTLRAFPPCVSLCLRFSFCQSKAYLTDILFLTITSTRSISCAMEDITSLQGASEYGLPRLSLLTDTNTHTRNLCRFPSHSRFGIFGIAISSSTTLYEEESLPLTRSPFSLLRFLQIASQKINTRLALFTFGGCRQVARVSA